MALMEPSTSIGGTGRNALVKQRLHAAEAIYQAMKALQETKPHGRDYVGRAYVYEKDRATYRDRFNILDKFRNELLDEAHAIHDSGRI